MSKILVVEDDRDLNNGVCIALSKDNHEVFSAYSKKDCDLFLSKHNFDFIVLDINLPDGNGIEICREVRVNSDVPILFFSASDTETDMLNGYEVGCDDYISKPFSIEVLKQKINVMLNRNVQNKNTLIYKDLKIDYDKIIVKVGGGVVNLSPTEYRLLEVLSKNKGKVMTKELLLQKIWDNSGNFVDENTVNVNINRLRKKIETEDNKYIITVFGIGYTFGN